MKRLSDPMPRRIVEHLACFRADAEVTDIIAEEFDDVLIDTTVLLDDLVHVPGTYP